MCCLVLFILLGVVPFDLQNITSNVFPIFIALVFSFFIIPKSMLLFGLSQVHFPYVLSHARKVTVKQCVLFI